jgi:hypothetical protein
VSSAAIRRTAATTVASWPGCHGEFGSCPSTHSNASTICEPSSQVPRNRGVGSASARPASVRPAAFRASSRYVDACNGHARASIAFAKARVPPAIVSLDAKPGEKPPGQFTAATTCPPTTSSIC